jgi:archaellum component FlaC
MADGADNIVLIYLRRFEEKLDRVADDVRDLKTRMTNVEEGLGQIDLRFAQVEISIAGINRRLDRVDARLDRIERRLDLVELPH